MGELHANLLEANLLLAGWMDGWEAPKGPPEGLQRADLTGPKCLAGQLVVCGWLVEGGLCCVRACLWKPGPSAGCEPGGTRSLLWGAKARHGRPWRSPLPCRRRAGAWGGVLVATSGFPRNGTPVRGAQVPRRGPATRLPCRFVDFPVWTWWEFAELGWCCSQQSTRWVGHGASWRWRALEVVFVVCELVESVWGRRLAGKNPRYQQVVDTLSGWRDGGSGMPRQAMAGQGLALLGPLAAGLVAGVGLVVAGGLEFVQCRRPAGRFLTSRSSTFSQVGGMGALECQGGPWTGLLDPLAAGLVGGVDLGVPGRLWLAQCRRPASGDFTTRVADLFPTWRNPKE